MAILRGYPGLEADIIVNKLACKEYHEPEDSNKDTPNSATRYIEAQDGANFTIRLRLDRRFKHIKSDLAFGILLDGNVMRETFLEKARHTHGRSFDTEGALGGSAGAVYEKKFLFSTLNTTDAPIKSADKKLHEKLKSLGEITVRVSRVIAGKLADGWVPPTLSDDLETISEKALKGRAVSRKAKLGTATPIVAPQQQNVDWIDPREKPLASFKFLYRSMNDLKAELIVPRSESPVPLEERSIEDLSPEEMRELLKRQKRQIAESARVKTEAPRNVKREREGDSAIDVDDDEVTALPAKRRCIETVDLTGD